MAMTSTGIPQDRDCSPRHEATHVRNPKSKELKSNIMGSDAVQDKHGNPIEVGDQVFTKIRGGKREGEVEKIVTTEEEAKKEDVKNPPKVVFTDQHGHHVAHNPGTLEDLSKK